MWKSESSDTGSHAFLEQNAWSDGCLWRYIGIVSPFTSASVGGEALHSALPRPIATRGLSICQYVGGLLSTWRDMDDKGSERRVCLLLYSKI
jgi:hypothetical protein